MSINIVAFIFGCILILIGIIGGGFELKELKIPKVGSFTRVIAILGGAFFISMGIGFLDQERKQVQPVEPVELTSTTTPIKPLSIDSKDSIYEKAIIGTWKDQEVTPEGEIYESTTTYAPNGQISMFGTISTQEETFPVVVSGTWMIKEGYLYTTVKSSNAPMILPVGFSSSDEIINITNKELRYISDGEITVEFRVK